MIFADMPKRFRILLGGAICACLSIVPFVVAQKGKPAASQQTDPKKTEKDADVPFKSGEKLNFQVLFSRFTVKAGSVEFAVVEHRQFFGRSAWHLRVAAHSVDSVRILYPL